ncbi:MAG TPA: HEAT repeat domain-containing protein [Pirellulaceae bacterium]|nr:HEAT repeat domain-containing protein [Pirellulaceae bacterium]
MILLLAADPSARFDKSGNRLDDARTVVNLTPEQEAAFRTIAEWEEMVLTARSKTRRAEGARAVVRLSLHKHQTPLSDSELLAAQNVIFKLLDAQEVEVRRDAARTLGKLGFASSAPNLRQSAARDEDLFVRASCYQSLGLLKDGASIDLLAKAVVKEGPTPAIEAAHALEAIGSAEAHAALADLSKKELNETVLEAVNKALDDLEFGN